MSLTFGFVAWTASVLPSNTQDDCDRRGSGCVFYRTRSFPTSFFNLRLSLTERSSSYHRASSHGITAFGRLSVPTCCTPTVEATLASILPLEPCLLVGSRALGSYVTTVAEVCPVPASLAPGLRLVLRAVAASAPRMPASSTHLVFAAPVAATANPGYAASHQHGGVLGFTSRVAEPPRNAAPRGLASSPMHAFPATSGPDLAPRASPRALASLRQFGLVHEAPPNTLLAPRSGARVLRWMVTQLALGDGVSTGSRGRSGGLAVGSSVLAATASACGGNADSTLAEPHTLLESDLAGREVEDACKTDIESEVVGLDDARKRHREGSDDGEGGGLLERDAQPPAPYDGAGAPPPPPPPSQPLHPVTVLPTPRTASAPLLTRSASLDGRGSTHPPRAAGILGAATADDVAAANLAYRSMRSRRKSIPGAPVNAAALFRITAMLQQQSQFMDLGLPTLAAGPYAGMPNPSAILMPPIGLGSLGSAAFVPGFAPLPPDGSPGSGHT